MIPSLFGETRIGQLPYFRTVKKHAVAVYSIFCTGVENDLREIDIFLLETEASVKTWVSLRDFGKEIKKENGCVCCEVPLQLKTNKIKGNLSSNYDVAAKRFIPLEERFYRDESLFERISEIQENTDPASWRHCSGKQNPADLLTRGLTSKELIISEKWWHGPEWLKDSENLWPKLERLESMDSETVELKSSLFINLPITHERIIDPDKYSSLLKLLRITAYIFRFVNALRRKDILKGPLAAEELSNAEIFWDSKLLFLNPFLDDNGVLRVTRRPGKTTHLSANEKHPIILPSKSRLTELLIWESHKRVFHSGVSHTLVQVRQEYWILKARQTIKSLLKKCITFKGLDFAGSLFGKYNDAKQYILLIACAVTRSIHLELVGSMTADTFLLAFRCFVARSGLYSMVTSDNARTFKRAELELQYIFGKC
ncbi:integrase catalytic domain-containing protein [Trichonephila clavipes]|nr:integrase catalytic domain-containing protein [Trichonephila clavipes]